MSSSNVELARRGYEALIRGDLEAVGALLDDNVKWHMGDPNAEEACRNRRQAMAWLRRPQRGEPGEVVEMIDAGDKVVVILKPPPIDGEEAPLRGQVTTFRGGKVVEMVGYPSVEAALAAAGAERSR